MVCLYLYTAILTAIFFDEKSKQKDLINLVYWMFLSPGFDTINKVPTDYCVLWIIWIIYSFNMNFLCLANKIL